MDEKTKRGARTWTNLPKHGEHRVSGFRRSCATSSFPVWRTRGTGRVVVVASSLLLSLFVVTAVFTSAWWTGRELDGGRAVVVQHRRPQVDLQERAWPREENSRRQATLNRVVDRPILETPAEDPHVEFNGFDYPEKLGAVLRKLAEECSGENEETLALLIERLQEYEEDPELGTDLIGHSFGLFHGLWSRAPHLRENARAIFNESDSAYTKRVLLQAMLLDDADTAGYFSELEYDILDTAITTADPSLLIDCVANIPNRRNREVNRAALDFALNLDPLNYGSSQHPGIDGVLNSYTAVIELYPDDETVREEMRGDLQAVTTFSEVNVYQFGRAVELLGQAQNDDLVSAILAAGTRAEDTEIAAYCRSRVSSDH